MPVLSWYWDRLRAMEPGELSEHIRRKLWQMRRAAAAPCADLSPEPRAFPTLPKPANAFDSLREALRSETRDILAGRWSLFRGLQFQVDDPPNWHKDYLSGAEVTTSRLARQLNHRELPGGADIKLIWELSRWNHLVRLAQAAYLLEDQQAGRKCVAWLHDWVNHNPAYRGWNWISALESGLRLIQFAWIDALLGRSPEFAPDLENLRRAILSSHVAFTWHSRTFGSSANNHLLGELAGLIVAVARWPALERCSTPLDRLQSLWESEVLKQFWEDGANKEQALHYQLFSWELCWTTRLALASAGRPINPVVEDRLQRAATFYDEVQAPAEPWDYGDSDDACVTPLYTSRQHFLEEWRAWISGASGRTAYDFWLGAPPGVRAQPNSHTMPAKEWAIHPKGGIATSRCGQWFLRWDLSPLGYLKPAAHGHLDALHLSIWYKDAALVIDPGTGAYYGDHTLRSWLASRRAHNGPCADSLGQPQRLGPFLWSDHHPPPGWRSSQSSLDAHVLLGATRVMRRIRRKEDGDGWEITDSLESGSASPRSFTVHWQFAPGAVVEALAERRFRISRGDASVTIDVDTSWADVVLVRSEAERGPSESPLAGLVAPSFRRATFAPYLRLRADLDDKPCVFRTTFLACDVR